MGSCLQLGGRDLVGLNRRQRILVVVLWLAFAAAFASYNLVRDKTGAHALSTHFLCWGVGIPAGLIAIGNFVLLGRDEA